MPEGLYFSKDRLKSWDGLAAFPGVITPAEGQNPRDPMSKLEVKGKDDGEPEEKAS